MRRAHYLKPNAMGETPSHLIFVDTETRNEAVNEATNEAVLWFGYAAYVRRLESGAYSRPQWIRFDTAPEFWRWALAHALGRTRLYLFAHNIGFDAQVLDAFDSLNTAGYKLVRAIVDDPPTVLTFRREHSTVLLVDSLNIFRMPLAALGESIGAPKLPMPTPEASRSEWDTYCQNDCAVLMRSIVDWISFVVEEDLGNFTVTLASQALAAFRHRFMGTPIFIDDNDGALTLARRGYMGGRTEAFWYGPLPEQVYVVDINSQYPAVMAQEAMPTKLRSVWRRVSLAELSDICEHGCAVAEVRIATDTPRFPTRWEGRLVFPVGTFDTVLCTPELRDALQHNSIVSLGRVAVYESAVVFAPFVDYFYAKRMAAKARGDAAKTFNYKILMNSLYGKFGQTGRVFEEVGQADDIRFTTWQEKDHETGEIYNVRQVANLLQRMKNEGESANSSPAIAAHVTSGGRVLLQSFIDIAGAENVYYCDTDSLMVNAVGLERLQPHLHETNLGALKLEKTIAEAEIWGAKDYVLDGVATIKGIKKRAVKLDENTYQQDSFRGLKGMLRDGDHDRMLITSRTVHLSREYHKGTVDGVGRIAPLVFSEG